MKRSKHSSDPFSAISSGDLWVFGYGSLMWRPGFDYVQKEMATLYGYRRALCVWCHDHRGTTNNPGLVFGLDAGGSCRGIAFRVADRHKHSVMEYLYERELINPVYVPRWLTVQLGGHRRVRALTFATNRSHEQYAGHLSVEQTAVVVRRASGRSGHNIEYLANTVAQLAELGIRDRLLTRILNTVA